MVVLVVQLSVSPVAANIYTIFILHIETTVKISIIKYADGHDREIFT